MPGDFYFVKKIKEAPKEEVCKRPRKRTLDVANKTN